MAESLATQLYDINRFIYRYFSKKEPVEKTEKVAWITSFVPVELLEALNIAYVYPESYAAVIASSGKAIECLEWAKAGNLSLDCCSYSTCFNGCLSLGRGPRGLPPKPDILIASNNQCNTLPNWWNLLAQQMDVPLIVLDYPGENNCGMHTAEYVKKQHENLIVKLEQLSRNRLDEKKLLEILSISKENVSLWKYILELFPKHEIMTRVLSDYISPLILARSRPETGNFYRILSEELVSYPQRGNKKRIYWAGYPLWYDAQRYLTVEGMQIVGSNYASWWNLDYGGDNVWDMLYHAYNFTVLNLTGITRSKLINDDLVNSKADGVIINRNKSCKRDFFSLNEFNSSLPCAVIESDMIDAGFIDMQTAIDRINILIAAL